MELPLWFGRGYAAAETYGERVAALVRTSRRVSVASGRMIVVTAADRRVAR